ncbi:UDP-N-acetylmuramoyl-tripeptide--D-alanyl-D-alanine ligase [Rhodovibrionaceae bacterium A322]
MTSDLPQPALWTASEVLNATQGRGPKGWQAQGVTIDSRTVEPGDLFVAIKGPSFDGHDFVAAALEQGAAAALVHQRPANLPADAPLVEVHDSLKGLEDLGRAARKRCSARIIGVTGSAGKTGSKEALRCALSSQGKTVANASSLNNHWGVPLSLARLPRDAAFGISEMGMNHAGELSQLTQMVLPDVALITNIGLAHMAFFASPEGIADAKAEIFEGLNDQGAAVLPRDDAQFDRLAATAGRLGVRYLVTFGRHADADLRLISVESTDQGSRVTVEMHGEPLTYDLPVPGEHWVANSLGVLATVRAVGANVERAAEGLRDLQATKGRGAQFSITLVPQGGHAGGPVRIIDDSYNANPLSVRAGLKVLAASAPKGSGRRVALLGEMLELGEETPRYHAELALPLQEAGVDLVMSCGDGMAHLDSALPGNLAGHHFTDSQALAAAAVEQIRPGDTVLIKGSLGSNMARVLNALKAMDTVTDSPDSNAPSQLAREA